MPQLLWGGLSENWLLKELGEVHWTQITTALHTASDKLVDSRGERLYASFVRLFWTGSDISQFSENDSFELKSELSRYGSKMFFSQTKGKGETGKLKAHLMSVFSTRSASDNTQLKKGNLKSSIQSKNLKTHQKLPTFAKEYLENKSTIFNDVEAPKTPTPPVVYREIYAIDAYDDINGVGLLYFASYPKISDKCERNYFNQQYDLKGGDWLEVAGIISRDVHYYGNANPGEKLIYELDEWKEKKGIAHLSSSLYRQTDNQLIARIFTKKVLKNGVSLGQIKVSRNIETLSFTEKPVQKAIAKPTVSNPSTTQKNQDRLNKIIIDFLSKMLDLKGLHPDSDLSTLGIESIVYLELSEFLQTEHSISSNPSLFYGAATISDLSNYLSSKSAIPSQNISSPKETQAVAIVGISGRFPNVPDLNVFWKKLKENQDLITAVPAERWDADTFAKNTALQSKWGGFMEGIDEFDPAFFNINRHEAELMDPQQRLTLQTVYAALEDAAIAPESLSGSETGVFIGVSGSDYATMMRERDNPIEAYHAIGTSPSILANRISYFLNISQVEMQSYLSIQEIAEFVQEEIEEKPVLNEEEKPAHQTINAAVEK